MVSGQWSVASFRGAGRVPALCYWELSSVFFTTETRRHGGTEKRGYGAFSVSESNVPSVSRYIARQEEHHKKRTFQQEYVAFLKKNKIAYDERYIWE